MMSEIDCVVVGYNDIDFQEFCARQQAMADYSGAYQEIKSNSILLDGRRVTYMDLLNRSLEGATGRPAGLSGFATPNLGAVCLVNMLRKHGCTTEIVNFFNHDRDAFERMLKAGVRSVAITTTYYTDSAPIKEIVSFVRERSPDTRIVVGGPHIYNLCADYPPKMQDAALAAIGADFYVFDSQGELTLAQLVAALGRGGSDAASVPNLLYRDAKGTLVRTPRVPERNPMDEIAIDWRRFDRSFFAPTVYLRTARSCPFSCAFCNYPTLAGDHEMQSLAVLEAELRYLHESGVRNVIFVDDTFNVPLPRFKKICRMMIENRFGFRWASFFRCSNSDEEAFDLMAESGCLGVLLGIESGDQTILNNMNKAVKIERYFNGIKALKRRGIVTYGLFFIGFPGETGDTIANTTQFIQETEPDFFLMQLYYHNIHVPVHRRAAEFGIEGAGYSWRHRTMDWRQASAAVEEIYRTIRTPIILPLYGVSLWTVPYLLDHGLDLPTFKSFARKASDMLVRSLDDRPVDFTPDLRELAALLGGAIRGVAPAA
jgi:radical SAM PhpK family P-methyltransferase